MRLVILGMGFLLASCAKVPEEIPVINVDQASEMDINLSDFVESVEIIPLQTSDEYLISSPTVYIDDDFMLVGSRVDFNTPGRLFRFDRSGQFMNEIGKGTGGKGPGEHTGVAKNIRYYSSDSIIQVNWGGAGNDPQFFSLNGEFIHEISLPYQYPAYAERWDDDTWFGSGRAITGAFGLDSALVYFFSREGQVMNTIPRKVFSQSESGVLVPLATSPYRYNGNWKFYMDGYDTLFRVVDQTLVPEAIFASRNWMPYNTATTLKDYSDKVSGYPVYETGDYWLWRVTRMVVTDMEAQIGARPLTLNNDFPLLLVNKASDESSLLRLTDDLLQLLPREAFAEWFGAGRIQFQDNRMILLANADEVVSFLKDRTGEVGADVRAKLTTLDNLHEEDNPVIIVFTLKETVSLN